MNRTLRALMISELQGDLHEAIGNAANYTEDESEDEIPFEAILGALQVQILRELKDIAQSVGALASRH